MTRDAIILATEASLLNPATAQPRGAIDYTTRVGGVPLIERSVLAARRAGVERFTVVLGRGGGWIADRLAGKETLSQGVEWLSLDDEAARDALHRFVTRLDRPVLVLRAGRVFQPDALKQLSEHAGLAPVVSATAPDGRKARPREAGLYVCERPVLEATLDELDAPSPFDSALARYVGDGRRAKVELRTPWVLAPTSREDKTHANGLLLNSLIKPVDGVVSRNINRRVSLPITRLVMDWDVFTPNVFTVIALVLGLASAVMVATGSFLWMAVGGLLYQLSSILDGNDGEIARIKFMGSDFGAWFDTVSDDITNLSFILGLGFGAARLTGHTGWLVFAVIGVVMGVFVVVQLYTWLLTHTDQATTIDVPWEIFEGDEASAGWLVRALRVFEIIGKRDFYALLFAVLCVLGLIQIPLILGATTTIVMGLLKIKEALSVWLSTPAPQPVREVTATGVRRR